MHSTHIHVDNTNTQNTQQCFVFKHTPIQRKRNTLEK